MFNQKVGAFYNNNGSCFFNVWAPLHQKVAIWFENPEKKSIDLIPDNFGYWSASIDNICVGERYLIMVDDEKPLPDPASNSQPDGVHDASQVISRDFEWGDTNWHSPLLSDLIIYELHVGTFTTQGTFEGVISKLDYFKKLGINAIEIMPVGQFPGSRNWGYDGVYCFATQNSYGGANGFKKLINAAHNAGIAIILDVVYNHIGPEGNYLQNFAPYFTDKYKTPWGSALNFDDAFCDGVRNYFIQNALMWLDEFHVDGLRLDAVHAIYDLGATHFLKQLRSEVSQLENNLGAYKFLVAESDLNDTKLINNTNIGGYGLDGQWLDEFHHSLHCVLTGENNGFYNDFGDVKHLEKVLKDIFVYNGTFSKFRNKVFGSVVTDNHFGQFIVFAQNHDHIGNRPNGNRLTQTLPFEKLKLAAAAILLSPFVPLLFMGEEYGEKNPFLYFIHHSDELAEIVREGRKKEFESFDFNAEFSDPQSEESFKKSTLSWDISNTESAHLFNLYKYLITFRKENKAIAATETKSMIVNTSESKYILAYERVFENSHLLIVFNFGDNEELYHNDKLVNFKNVFHSSTTEWGGNTQFSSELLLSKQSISVIGLSASIFEKFV